jgi:predicted glycosyltransferase
MKNKTIVYAILNWGLGHVTRSTPIIERLINDGNRVIIVSHGKALILLKEQFPNCIFRDIRDKNIEYSRLGIMFVFKILSQYPKMILGWWHEKRKLKELIKEFDPDLIMTEMRLGFWSKKIPSVLITNQLRFELPKGLKWGEILGEWFNFLIFRHYDHIFVPDVEGEPNLLGNLAHKGRIAKHPKLRFVGSLTSIDRENDGLEEDIDLFVSISGPEPQRTKFEEIILPQLTACSSRIVVALGVPGDKTVKEIDHGRIKIYSHLERKEMSSILKRAKYVVSRSGFSTVNELFVLKKKALLVPTPGQTEQEYIARYLHQQGLFGISRQEDLDLSHLPDLSAPDSINTNIPINDLDHIMDILGTLDR